MSKILVELTSFIYRNFYLQWKAKPVKTLPFVRNPQEKKMREKGWLAFQLFLPWRHPLTTKYLKIYWAKSPLSNHEHNVWKNPLRDKMLWVSCSLPYRWQNTRTIKYLKYVSKRNTELVTVLSLWLWRPRMHSSSPHGRISSIETKPHS